jgi:hypothetical protein
MTTRAGILKGALALVGSTLALSVAACASQSPQCGGKTCVEPEAGGAAGAPNDPGSSGDTASGGTDTLAGAGGGAGTEGGTHGHSENGGSASVSGGSAGAGGELSAAGGEAGASGQGSASGGESGATQGERSCDSSLSPYEDTCVIDEAHGVFVAPDGDDELGDGSRNQPYATIARGVAAALTQSKRVYACASGGPYTEKVALAGAIELEMFGGFSCSDWTYDTNAKSEIVSPTTVALRIDEVTSLRIEDFHFQAANAVLTGESSIGAFITNATYVALQRTLITAGDGMSGMDGTLTAYPYPSPESLRGNGESSEEPGTGGEAKVCLCQSMSTRGGAGGPPNPYGLPGENGLPEFGGGAAGIPPDCRMGGTGSDGASAPAVPPSPGATSLGVVTSLGWEPSAGIDGMTGQPGQGGGGGASRPRGTESKGEILHPGGGGGCGGCGGNGGQKGFGGGASIAMLVVDSSIELDSSNLSAADAGSGGRGHAGQVGQGADGTPVGGGAGACRGGSGGAGANGGAAGGGAGGISVGILWSGTTTPLIVATRITVGTPGSGGVGGEPGVNDGLDGVAEEVLLAP